MGVGVGRDNRGDREAGEQWCGAGALHANPALHLLVCERLDTLPCPKFLFCQEWGSVVLIWRRFNPRERPFETRRGNFWLSEWLGNQNASGTLNGKHWVLQTFKPSAFLCVICICDIHCCQLGNCGTLCQVCTSLPNPLGQLVAGPNFRTLRATVALFSLISCLGAKSFLKIWLNSVKEDNYRYCRPRWLVGSASRKRKLVCSSSNCILRAPVQSWAAPSLGQHWECTWLVTLRKCLAIKRKHHVVMTSAHQTTVSPCRGLGKHRGARTGFQCSLALLARCSYAAHELYNCI